MATMAGKEALMELLRNEGVEYVFGIPGSTEIQFMDALEKHPEMKYILGLQEVVVAGMAEGYARISGKPGFLNLHTGTGLGAAIPMLLNVVCYSKSRIWPGIWLERRGFSPSGMPKYYMLMKYRWQYSVPLK